MDSTAFENELLEQPATAASGPSRLHTLLIASAGVLLAVFLVVRAGDLSHMGSIIVERRDYILGFFLFSNIYLVLKGLALRQAARCAGVKTSFWRATRVFCESTVVGLLAFPGKVGSDVYKYARLGEADRKSRVRAVVIYRVAAIVAVLVLSALVSIVWAEQFAWKSRLVWAVPALVLMIIILKFKARLREWLAGFGRSVLLVAPYSLAALAAKICGTAILLGVSLDGGLIEVAAAFLLIGSLASLSQMPAGVGMLDAGYAVFLTKYIGTTGAEAATFLIAFRLFGPVYTSALGALSMGGDYLARFRQPNWRTAINPDACSLKPEA